MAALYASGQQPRKMNIISWNVAGVRARLRDKYMVFLERGDYDVVCLQETKAEEKQVQLPQTLMDMYPHRQWNATKGTTQRKGLSGTAIWSKQPVERWIPTPEFDEEGRITAAEFDKFILVTVYTPNSQSPESERHVHRVCIWDPLFRAYIAELDRIKPVVLCGDLNVAHEDIDVYHPDKARNKMSGCLDSERSNLQQLLSVGFKDAFRILHQEPEQYTYWDQKSPALRTSNRGWRIDYFLVSDAIVETHNVRSCEIRAQVFGSDHCPVTLELEELSGNDE
jgi:exodeoxyribonuclease-3